MGLRSPPALSSGSPALKFLFRVALVQARPSVFCSREGASKQDLICHQWAWDRERRIDVLSVPQ